MLEQPCRLGWIACGDALQTADPIASSGNLIALKRGLLAAEAADRRRDAIERLCARRSAGIPRGYGLQEKLLRAAFLRRVVTVSTVRHIRCLAGSPVLLLSVSNLLQCLVRITPTLIGAE
jgi:flavin-dependent dehydrogenase